MIPLAAGIRIAAYAVYHVRVSLFSWNSEDILGKRGGRWRGAGFTDEARSGRYV
jgi:hypothetical protein